MTSRSPRRVRTILLGAAVALSALPAASLAQTRPFSFNDVEFMPKDQRDPAAHAFVAQNITPGMPVQAARAVLQRAGAYCPEPKAGMMACMHSSMQRPPGHSEQDVTWKIDVQADGAGRVMGAVVRRTVAGN